VNIASFLSPKEEVTFLRDDMTIRQGLEKMKRYGYTAVPVIDAEDRYVGVVSEGDFLWNILSHNSELDSITMKSLEKLSIRDIRYVSIRIWKNCWDRHRCRTLYR